MLVVQLKKTDYNTQISEIEKKITAHIHDTYKTTLEFNKLTTGNFAARLKQANLVTKTNFDDKLKNLNKKHYFKQNKTKHVVVENQKHLIQSIFMVKVILKIMVIKITQYFRRHIDILKQLVIMPIFHHRNLKDCLMRVLSLLLCLIKCLILH